VSDQPPWDLYGQQDPPQQQRPPRYRPQPAYGQESYPQGQPQDGQQDWGPYPGQSPYRQSQPPPQPPFTSNPQYGAPPGQSPYQEIPRGQPYPQAAPQWYDTDLNRQHAHDQFRQQQAGSGPPPHRRKRSRGPVYAVIAGLIVIAGAGAAYALVGQEAGSASAAKPPSQGTGSASAAKPLSCKQQYNAWKTGPAHARGKQLAADLNKISAAGNVEDITALTSALEAVGADAAALEQYPMPACADPDGYWGQMLARIKAAGDNAGSASGLGGILLAEAPLKQVPGLQQKLSAELKRAAITGSG
jgi:hypothetical protein